MFRDNPKKVERMTYMLEKMLAGMMIIKLVSFHMVSAQQLVGVGYPCDY